VSVLQPVFLKELQKKSVLSAFCRIHYKTSFEKICTGGIQQDAESTFSIF
jgi:hypothetical protein